MIALRIDSHRGTVALVNAVDRTERLARTVGRLRRSMAARAARAMEREGAPLVHWQLVSAIAHEGLSSQMALSARVGMDPAGTSRALDELEAKGLVKRERDADDRRRVSLALTPRGRRWYARARTVVMEEISPLFDALSITERKTLERLLEKVDHSSGSLSPGSV
jgi:MarR family transcriptional regulator for hemolysin